MFKDNGRFKEADKEELAGIKGKEMLCNECGNHAVLTEVQFADEKCSVCGAQLVDLSMAKASKATGR